MKIRFSAFILALVMLVCMAPIASHAGTLINTVAIEDVVVPREGILPGYYYLFNNQLVSPDYEMNDPTTYQGIMWEDMTEAHAMQKTETYLAGHTYRINITLNANDGMKFDEVKNMTVTVDGQPAADISIYNKDIYGYGTQLWLCFDYVVEHEHRWEENIVSPGGIGYSGFITKKCSGCGEESGLITIPMVGDIEMDENVQLYGATYTGKNIKPSVMVYDEYGASLLEGTDYVLDYPISDKEVGNYEVTVRFIGYYEGEYTLHYSVHLGQPLVKTKTGVNFVTLSWDKVPGATYYRVWEKNLKTGKMTAIAKTTKLTIKRTGKTPGKEYVYSVIACTKKAGKEIRSPYNKEYDRVSCCTLCKAPVVKQSHKGKTVTLKWGKCSGASYYRVLKYNQKTKKFTVLTTVSAKKLSVKLKNQSKGTHYYLVRSYNLYGQGSSLAKKNLAKVVIK